jgi:hypothetical protein
MNGGRDICAAVVLAGVLLLNAPQEGIRKAVPAPTAIPVVFTRAIDASKANAGDRVVAKTIQVVLLPNGTVLPKGAAVLGHVTGAHAFSFDPTPYAIQQPSFLSIHFDSIVTKDAVVRVSVSVRALANSVESEEAGAPHGVGEGDAVGTRIQIGGDTFSPLAKPVVNPQGDIVGYNRRNGVFAHLLPAVYTSRYSHLTCDGTDAEQSVAIFSASACGLYGFADVYMTENGNSEDQVTFRVESRRHTVKLYGQSTALLLVTTFRGDNGTQANLFGSTDVSTHR